MANQRDIDRWKKGKDHWNKWAEGRLKAKEKLERQGKWEVDYIGAGANTESQRWIKSASVDFIDHVFEDKADFNGIVFPHLANFSYAKFKRAALFQGAVFYWNAGFYKAIFYDRAWLYQATFSGDAWFDRAEFFGYAMFGQCTFDGRVTFHSAEFIGDTSCRSAKSGGPFSLANATFGQVPDFIQMSFRAPPRLDDLVVIPARPFQTTGDKDRAASYRALKKIAIEAHDHVREQEFFASELRERRGNDDPVRSLRYILNFIYEMLSNFGTSLKRPLAWLFGVWLVMAAVYGTWVPAATRQDCGWLTSWMAPEHYLSLLHTLPFIGLVRSGRRELALKCLYESEIGFGAGTDVAFIAHNTFAAVLIFLFFLAVRNHFKIK